MKVAIIFIVLLSNISMIFGHSWVACTDYRINSVSDGDVFNSNQCFAYARNYKNGHLVSTFGLDTGYDYRPNNAPLCKYPLTSPYSNSYSDAVPMAKYSPGQQICMAWPSKNHVAATCINPYIPDNGLKIYMSSPNPTADATSVSQLTLVHDFGKNTVADGHVGFQNCSQFCSNPDKSTCIGCFNLPNDLQAGAVYTFVWVWGFNSDTDLYSSCFEAQIDGTTGSNSQSTTESNSQSTTGSNSQSTTSDNNNNNNPSTTGTDHSCPTNPSTTQVQSNAINSADGSCTRNEDCVSGICQIGGTCKQEQFFTTPIILAIAFGGAAFVAIVVAIFAVLCRYRMKRLPYV